MRVARRIISRPFVPLLLLQLALLAAGCEVGPRYTKATVPTAPNFKEDPPQAFKEAGQWTTAQPEDQALRGKWWEVLGDRQLNQLEEQLTDANLDLKVAEARLREARA